MWFIGRLRILKGDLLVNFGIFIKPKCQFCFKGFSYCRYNSTLTSAIALFFIVLTEDCQDLKQIKIRKREIK